MGMFSLHQHLCYAGTVGAAEETPSVEDRNGKRMGPRGGRPGLVGAFTTCVVFGPLFSPLGPSWPQLWIQDENSWLSHLSGAFRLPNVTKAMKVFSSFKAQNRRCRYYFRYYGKCNSRGSCPCQPAQSCD